MHATIILSYPLFSLSLLYIETTRGTLSTVEANEEEEDIESMMIQKVINYDWDEKWGFGNYDNNWWKAANINGSEISVLSAQRAF